MSRLTTSLAVAVLGLAVSNVDAQNKVLKQVIAPNNESVDLPPVLAPNDNAVAMPQPGVGNQTPAPAQLILDPSQPNQLAYFSPRLGARFLIQQMHLPQFGSFWAARIVSVPEFDSPLRQLGLDEGDVITRLDGIPVMNTRELERHILDTGVRFIKAGSQTVVRGTMFINPNRFFVDPYRPGCVGTPICGTTVLRP